MRTERIRNNFIRGTAHVRCFGDKVREAKPRWFGLLHRRDIDGIGGRMQRPKPLGSRAGGMSKKAFMDVAKENTKLVRG